MKFLPATIFAKAMAQAKCLLSFFGPLKTFMACSYRYMVQRLLRLHPFWIHLFYFVSIAFLGSLVLQLLDEKDPTFSPKYIDLLYMSTSALTVSGLNSVQMEVFSTSQVMVLTLLMFLGGEVPVYLINVLLTKAKLKEMAPTSQVDTIELDSNVSTPTNVDDGQLEVGTLGSITAGPTASGQDMNDRCMASLAVLVISYLALFHIIGFLLILLYIRFTSSARRVLRMKGLPLAPFALSVTVSSFANGGLIPTNENMGVFIKNSGLLLVIVVLVLAGNTLFPSVLRLAVFVLSRITGRKDLEHMLKNPQDLQGILPGRRSRFVASTAMGIVVAQLVLFCAMDWRSGNLAGLSSFQKLVNGLFQATNARHCGESTIDISAVSTAVLVLIIVAMYLPANVAFIPSDGHHLGTSPSSNEDSRKGCKRWLRVANLSQPSYIAIFIIIVCIIERRRIADDPLNFSLLFVSFEVVSAYGNVGFSPGYACKRQLHPDGNCQDLLISLSGKWSNGGKLMLIFIVLFGRLKRFHIGGGKAWKLN